MNKGFTLIEIIITLAILALLIAVSVPNIMRIIDKNKEKQSERINELIVDATRVFIGRNYEAGESDARDLVRDFRAKDIPEFTITVQDLKDEKLIEKNFVDPTTKNGTFDYGQEITIKRVSSNVTITFRGKVY